MKKVLVLGCGRMGSTIARDLSAEFGVTVADSNWRALQQIQSDLPEIQTEEADLVQDPSSLSRILGNHDLAIGALPGQIGFSVLKAVISHGCPAVDISFFPEDPAPLIEMATDAGIPIAIDCGLAPGLCNLMLGRHLDEMEVVEYRCLVGGLPVQRILPFQYKAPFSPRDVIEEYIRPVHLRRQGREIILPAMSEPELINFPEIGSLEAFNTDGLRTLLRTTSVPDMVEKTLRYPGHREQIEFLRQSGFLDPRRKVFGSCSLSPIEVTAAVLEAVWAFRPGEPDLTLMRVEISGKQGVETRGYIYELVDHFDARTQTTSMSRTTGFTCAAVARLILQDQLIDAGLWTPESIGRNPKLADFVLDYLAAHGIRVQER